MFFWSKWWMADFEISNTKNGTKYATSYKINDRYYEFGLLIWEGYQIARKNSRNLGSITNTSKTENLVFIFLYLVIFEYK